MKTLLKRKLQRHLVLIMDSTKKRHKLYQRLHLWYVADSIVYIYFRNRCPFYQAIISTVCLLFCFCFPSFQEKENLESGVKKGHSRQISEWLSYEESINFSLVGWLESKLSYLLTKLYISCRNRK